MSWVTRYRIRLYLRNSVWVFPSLGMLVALILGPVLRAVDAYFGSRSDISPGAAQTILVTLASAMFTFIVFVSSALLLALQLASAQLTPRVIAMVFRDLTTKSALALFVFTFTFLVVAVNHIGDSVPNLSSRFAAYSCVFSIVVFFYMIDHLGKSLRPIEILRKVALEGRKVIDLVYSRPLMTPAPNNGVDRLAMKGSGEIVTARRHGVVLACDVAGLVALAERSGCVVELLPQIGDFVPSGGPLLRVFGADAEDLAPRLRRMVAIGFERNMEQDPAFAFRIIVDIAAKALSPAINDPTTAVLALDQLQNLLRAVGTRCLDDTRIFDSHDRMRLLYRTPGWEDFVRLAVTEIRQFGSQSIQVVRRLRAMLENLVQTLPHPRAASLQRELEILHQIVARSFPEPQDQALASVSDSQGVGGRPAEELAPSVQPAN